MATVTRRKDIPTDIEGFRKFALGVFVEKSQGRDLDQVMIDLGYTQKEIDKARDAGKATLVYTVTLRTNQRSEAMGRDYLGSIRDAARSYLGVMRSEEVDVTYTYTRDQDEDETIEAGRTNARNRPDEDDDEDDD